MDAFYAICEWSPAGTNPPPLFLLSFELHNTSRTFRWRCVGLTLPHFTECPSPLSFLRVHSPRDFRKKISKEIVRAREWVREGRSGDRLGGSAMHKKGSGLSNLFCVSHWHFGVICEVSGLVLSNTVEHKVLCCTNYSPKRSNIPQSLD